MSPLDLEPPRHRSTTALPDGRLLGWAAWGSADGQVVLFCPGAGTSSSLGFGASHLDALGLRLIAIDRPGLGASTYDPSRTFRSWAEDVRAFLNVHEIHAPSILGFSQGAPFALACAAAGLVSAVALVSASDELAHPALRPLLPAELGALVDLCASAPTEAELRFRAFEGSAQMWRLITQMCPPEDLALYSASAFERAYRGALDEGFSQGTAGYARDTRLAMSAWSFDLGEIGVPVDIWYGERDTSPVHSPDLGETLVSRLPLAHRHVIADAAGALLWTHARSILISLKMRATERRG